MTFTIEQLEALKEGTTPGPWEATKNDILRAGWRGRLLKEYPWYAEDEWEEEIDYMASDDEFVLSNPEPDYRPLTDNRADMELVAAAPALLDQLIAEKKAHQKLRKRIEERIRELKQPLCSHMPEGDELDDYVEQWSLQSYEAEMLAQILEETNG